jgi:gamma-glutamylcyclotransferase
MSFTQPPSPEPTLYFAYGSNLSLSQMSSRCPSSTPLGIASLKNHKWIINTRGFANIIPGQSEVWGLVYSLTPTDINRLDKNEGVPWAYTKETHEIEFWPSNINNNSKSSSSSKNADFVETSIEIGKVQPVKTNALVYIDRQRVEEGEPREEYIYRMNHGIIDALKVGIPPLYIEKEMRRFIPTMEDAVARNGSTETR